MLLQHREIPSKELSNISQIVQDFVSRYTSNTCGDVTLAKQRTSDDYDFSVDVPEAMEDSCLESFSDAVVMKLLLIELDKVFPGECITPSGFFLYPATGGYMSWHTNSNTPYKRLYIVYSETGDSFFKYRHKGEIVSLQDKPGVNFYWFETPAEDLFWHCVYSECNRFSFGFRFV